MIHPYLIFAPRNKIKAYEDCKLQHQLHADTLGAIVGSIAEAIWGIPEKIKKQALSFLDDRMKSLLRKWKRSKLIKTISLKEFTEKYITYFLNDFDPKSASYYDLFDSPDFPDECWSLGFDMDCGESFI